MQCGKCATGQKCHIFINEIFLLALSGKLFLYCMHLGRHRIKLDCATFAGVERASRR